MKTPLALLIILSFICPVFAPGEPQDKPKAADEVRLKVFWKETKTKAKKRAIQITVRNEGYWDVQNQPAELVIYGKGEREKQSERVIVNVSKNREQTFEILLSTERRSPTGSGFSVMGQDLMPIMQIDRAELLMSGALFTSL